MSTRNEKAKRLNANEENLLQMEMERFQKQHNKEMKSIILEKQTAKEAMSGVRRQRVSSLLVARMILQETDALNNRSNSPTLSEKVFCEAKQNQVSSNMVRGLDTDEDGSSSCWETYLLNPTKKESDRDKNDQFGRSRKRTQTFSEGKTTSKAVPSSGTLKNTLIVQKPCPPNPSQNDAFERSPRIRPRSVAEGVTDAHLEGACSRSRSRLNHVTIFRNLANQYQVQQGNSADKNIPFLLESGADDNKPRSRSDDSMLFKRVPTPKDCFEKRNLFPDGSSSARSRRNNPEPDSFHSPLILRASLARTPSMNRPVGLETGKLLTKRSSLEPCHKSSTQSQNKLSPSRGIAKFRQTGSAAALAQTLVSRYQREKAIANATENLIAERQNGRDKVCQGYHQMKEDWAKAVCTHTTGLKEGFFTVPQPAMAWNAMKKAASGGSTLAEK